MFEDSRSGFSAASENQWVGIKSEKFQRISGFGLAWEDTDRIGLAGSATAGACRAVFESFQAGKEKCCPLCGRHFFKIENV